MKTRNLIDFVDFVTLCRYLFVYVKDVTDILKTRTATTIFRGMPYMYEGKFDFEKYRGFYVVDLENHDGILYVDIAKREEQ